MVYENVNVNPTMPYYQYYQQQMQMPLYYPEMYGAQSYYYQPNMNGGYMFEPIMSGYMPPYANNSYMPSYANDVNYAPNTYYEEASVDGIAPNRVMQQFLDENGQVDIQKMLRTVGQFADTVQQVSPVIKQLNDLIRSFRA